MRSWRYLPIRNHDNRSFADRIRLCPGISKNSENGKKLSKASQGCLSWLKQWEERSALRLRLLTAIWILSWRSSLLCKGNWWYRRPEWTKRVAVELECGYSPQTKHRKSYLFGSPEPALTSAKATAGKSTLERALQCDALAFLPISKDSCWLHIHTHTQKLLQIQTHSPPPTPDPSPPSLWNRQPDKRVCD